ncbi:MAG: hypothetical protein AAF944_29595 [Bacteroidota bacterium]
MINTNISLDAKLQTYRLSLSNALNYPALKKPLATFSFDRPKLLKGEKLLTDVLALQSTKDDTYGAQKAATDNFNNEREAVRKQFGEHRQLAKLAFKGQRDVEAQLQLNIRVKTTFKGWVSQATAFYEKIGQHSNGMIRYGVTEAALQTNQAELSALIALADQQTQRRAEAQDNTEQRNKAMKELDEWMRDFYQVAKIALKDNPQLLETLGIVVPTQV